MDMYSTGPLYHEMSPAYNEHCPPYHEATTGNYYGNQNFHNSYTTQQAATTFEQSYSMQDAMPGLNMRSHQSPQNDLTTVTNAPDMQWMVTTSNIDIRTLTPPINVEASSSISYHQNYQSSMPSFQQGSQMRPTTSSRVQNKSNLTKDNKPKGTPGRKRKIEDHQLPPEEAAKRRLRRERNKVAAAKCRNRRRELTEKLQGETDHLEDIKNMLHSDILDLQRQKEHLESILSSHGPFCKSGVNTNMFVGQEQMMPTQYNMESEYTEIMQMATGVNEPQMHHQQSLESNSPMAEPVSVIQMGPRAQSELNYEQIMNESIRTGSLQQQQRMEMQPESSDFTGLSLLEPIDTSVCMTETLNTPVCSLATPSNTNSVFTFPSTPTSSGIMSSVYSSSAIDFTSSASGSNTIMSTGQNQPQFPASSCYYANNRALQTCSEAHRRSSSSESHQSQESVCSPKLLSL